MTYTTTEKLLLVVIYAGVFLAYLIGTWLDCRRDKEFDKWKEEDRRNHP